MQTAANASTQTASMSSGNLTTTGSSDLLYCVFADKNEGAMAIGTGFIQDEIDTGFGALSEYKRNLTAGAYSCNGTDTAASSYWLAYAVAFKASSSSPTLQSIMVSPTTASVPVAGTQPFTATGHYSDGSTTNLTNTATWSASGSTGGGGGSLSFVQGGKTGYSESAHVACAAKNNTANNLLLAAVYSTSNSVALSVSDTMGNIWTALPSDSSSNGLVQLFYAVAKNTASNTISANQTSTTAIFGLFCSEWSGNATSGVLDVQTAANASTQTASMSSGNLTSTGSSDLLYCLFADKKEGAMTIGTGFTQDEIDTGFGALSEYKKNLTAGTYSCNATDTAASSFWLAYAAAFKAGGGSTAVASVNSTGIATGLAAGTSTITAALTGISGSASLTVTNGDIWNDGGRNGGDDQGHRILVGSDGDLGRHGGNQRDRCEQHVDHGDHAGGRGGNGERSCDKPGRSDRDSEQRVYLWQLSTDCECDLAGIGNDERRHLSDTNRHEFRSRHDRDHRRRGSC